MTPELTNSLLLSVVSIATPVMVGLGGALVLYAKKRLGVQNAQVDAQVEANMRDKLQANLVTAVGMYALGNKAGAVQYVVANAADAMAHLNVVQAELPGLIESKAAAWLGAPKVANAA